MLIVKCANKLCNVVLSLELTEYIMVVNQNYIHRIDANSALLNYRLHTPISNLKNPGRLDYHYRLPIIL